MGCPLLFRLRSGAIGLRANLAQNALIFDLIIAQQQQYFADRLA